MPYIPYISIKTVAPNTVVFVFVDYDPSFFQPTPAPQGLFPKAFPGFVARSGPGDRAFFTPKKGPPVGKSAIYK